MEKDDYQSFERDCAQLAALETFDPNAFLGNAEVPQSLCNLVLALSLIFNDLRDLHYANILVGDCKPVGDPQKNCQWGYHTGIRLHVLRLVMGIIHELLNVIERQRDDVDHAFLREVVRGLPVDVRKDWQEVVRVGLGESTKDQKLGMLLLKIRNKVSFHYDGKAVHRGFRNHFLVNKFDERAYISRGTSMRECRFYFADAAAEGVLRETVGTETVDLPNQFISLLTSVTSPLILIVSGFIQKRGFGFRPEQSENSAARK